MTSSRRPPSPTPADEPAALAHAAAEAIRCLNHATRGDGLGCASAAYEVIAALTMAAGRTSQALSQISAYLDAEDHAGNLGHDLGHDPSTAVGTAAGYLDSARQAARDQASDLAAAGEALVFVNNHPRLFRKEQS